MRNSKIRYWARANKFWCEFFDNGKLVHSVYVTDAKQARAIDGRWVATGDYPTLISRGRLEWADGSGWKDEDFFSLVACSV
jgi:hypothetical protein